MAEAGPSFPWNLTQGLSLGTKCEILHDTCFVRTGEECVILTHESENSEDKDDFPVDE